MHEDGDGDSCQLPLVRSNADEPVRGASPNKDEAGDGIPSAAHGRQPSVGSDAPSLLEELVAIKLELATARTSNDYYRRMLKDTEAERDMYKERYEKAIQSKQEDDAKSQSSEQTKNQGGFHMNIKNFISPAKEASIPDLNDDATSQSSEQRKNQGGFHMNIKNLHFGKRRNSGDDTEAGSSTLDS